LTIRPGQPWGTPVEADVAVSVVDGDPELAAWLLDPATRGEAVTPRSGDVLRTFGLTAPREESDRYRFPVDLALVELRFDDGRVGQLGFVAHLTVRGRPMSGLGPGLSIAVLNAPWMGDLRLGPKAHLNDGRLDIVEGVVGFRQRREATRRARSGDHLPHPGLTTSRAAGWARTFARPTTIWLDGEPLVKVRSVEVELQPDAGEIIA
jgi:hypothetical protein